MPIDRTLFNLWVDDDGSNTVGTLINKSRIATDLLTPIDNATGGADFAFTGNYVIRRNTSDGGDTGSLAITGGGGSGEGRGGYVDVAGNEHSTRPGYVSLGAGNITGSQVRFLNAAGGEMLEMLGADGATTFTSSLTGAAWTFNGTAAAGGHLNFQRSGAGKGQIGIETDTIIVQAENTLRLQGSGSATARVNLDSTGLYPGTTNVVSLGKSGNIYTSVWATNTTIQTSDERHKHDWIPSLGLAFITALQPTGFRRAPGPYADGGWRHFGFSAQQVDCVLRQFGIPDAWLVRPPDGPDGYFGLAQGELTAPIVQSIQELALRVAQLEKGRAA